MHAQEWGELIYHSRIFHHSLLSCVNMYIYCNKVVFQIYGSLHSSFSKASASSVSLATPVTLSTPSAYAHPKMVSNMQSDIGARLTQSRVHDQARLVNVKATLLRPVLDPIPVLALVSALVDSKWDSLSDTWSANLLQYSPSRRLIIPCSPLHGEDRKISIAFCGMKQIIETVLWVFYQFDPRVEHNQDAPACFFSSSISSAVLFS